MGRARSLARATKECDAEEQLRTLQAKLARAIDGCESARDLAALSKQYRDCGSQLAALQPADEDEKDEFDGFD